MRSGMSLTAIKGATSYFQGFWVVFDCLREFQSRLMLDDVEDLINREVQGVKVMESWGSSPSSGERLPRELGSDVPLRASSSCQLECSQDHHVKWLL